MATSPACTDHSVIFARWHQCSRPSNTLFLGPTRVCCWHQSVQFWQGSLMCQMHTHTRTQTIVHHNVCSNRPHLAVLMMQSENDKLMYDLFSLSFVVCYLTCALCCCLTCSEAYIDATNKYDFTPLMEATRNDRIE